MKHENISQFWLNQLIEYHDLSTDVSHNMGNGGNIPSIFLYPFL